MLTVTVLSKLSPKNWCLELSCFLAKKRRETGGGEGKWWKRKYVERKKEAKNKDDERNRLKSKERERERERER